MELRPADRNVEQIHASGTATMIIISHQERIISLADEIIVVATGSCATGAHLRRSCLRSWRTPCPGARC